MSSTTRSKNATMLIFQFYYFCIYFAIGAMSPLLSVYFNEQLHLTTGQIGLLMSLSPIVTIFTQPLWGMLSDLTQNPKKMLLIGQFSSILIALMYSTVNSFSVLVIMVILLAITQSALIPLSDSLALTYIQKIGGNYGSIRLFGSIGFALAALFAGQLAKSYGLIVIFYVFAFLLFVGILIGFLLPSATPSTNRPSVIKGLPYLLKQKKFVLFLFFAFVVFGPVNANNTYFGLYIQNIGGTITGVGIAFLISAGSEAPFMQYAKRMISRFGMYNILLLSASVSALRWLLYFTEPPLILVYVSSVSQGLTVGLFIPAALQFVKQQAPQELQSTAVTVYASFGLGLGAWFSTFIGGYLSDYYSIHAIYILFALLSFIGVGIMVYLKRTSKIPNKEEIAS